MIARSLVTTIKKDQQKGFITIIYGPRRVGKTVLSGQLISDVAQEKVLFLNGDTQETRDVLSQTSEVVLSNLVKKYEVIVVDEAQRVTNIGLSLKILIDTFPEKKFYVTGSSALELARGIQEPLTGRSIKYIYHLFCKFL